MENDKPKPLSALWNQLDDIDHEADGDEQSYLERLGHQDFNHGRPNHQRRGNHNRQSHSSSNQRNLHPLPQRFQSSVSNNNRPRKAVHPQTASLGVNNRRQHMNVMHMHNKASTSRHVEGQVARKKIKNSLNEHEKASNFPSVPHIEREIRPMNFYRLKIVIDKGPNEILLIIKDNTSGFKLILEQNNIDRNIMAYILIALGKSILSHMRSNVTSMINAVTSSSNFLKNLRTYLASFQKYTSEQHHLDSLLSLSDFLHKFQLCLPSTASDILIELLPLLEKTCKLFLGGEIKVKVLKKLEEIDEQNSHFLKKYAPKEVTQASFKEKLQFRNPPENYRSIPVLPTIEDIKQPCSFLRPNLVKGQYQDTEHYLDVQYRLLREDYVKPLRDGIVEYLTLKKQGKSFKHCKDVKVYPDVHIIKQEFVNGGLVNIAHFNDENFAKIKWDFCKRFLSGSLLCLSSDDFETMLFATVAKRDTKELCKGLLLIRFEKLTDEVLNLSPLRNFVVVETGAYFEAYRHNLNAIIDLDEETLPMQPYIIEVQKNIQQPHYLKEACTYDLRPLLIPFDSKYVQQVKNIQGEVVTNYEFPNNVSQKARDVKILNDLQWPTHLDLNLDPSQYAALKAAVTKEFAIIQGPPGTGKTYVGLRIAQLLLHNMKKWQDEINPSPILVVCYTNHALDQFLEGLLLFTQSIVRVGGRGANEALSRFQLSNLKRTIEEKREVPMHIFKNIKQKHFELRTLKGEIDVVKRSVEKSYSTLLNELILKDCMSNLHYALLLSMHGHCEAKYIMHDWLGVQVGVDNQFEKNVAFLENTLDPFRNNYNAASDTNVLQPNVPEEEEDSEEEADIEYIEAQRDINSEEFADVSFEVPLYEKEPDSVPVAENENGWHVQGGKKRLQQYITNSLNNSKAMLEIEVRNIQQNIWTLPLVHRWRLYKYWLECHIEKKQKEVYELQQKLKKEFEELCEMRTEEDLYVCRQAHVVGMTTTGAAKYRNIVQHLNPKIVIVEEAAEILESHIVTSLAPNTQHVILIGDHQQLQPSPTVHLLAVKYDLNVSLFERMVKNDMECYRLGIQHRMRPEIAALLVPHIYTDLKNHESVTEFESIKGVSKNVFFITHNYSELQEFDSKSKVNQHEATFLVKLCRYILLQGYEPSQITVLTTYSGQLFALKKLTGKGLLQGVKFTVVDNYQGEENDIILISFVRSNEEGQIGFLKVSNRVCVALSRAKKGLFCIGNFELLQEQSDLWKNITSILHKNQAIGPSLQLICQNHPGVSSIVTNEKDFDSVPEGGCTRECEFRLSCGHVCSLMCHPYDREHETIRCVKSCSKTCCFGHLCRKKCFQNCGDCTELVDKIIQPCGHIIKVKCHVQNDETVCTKACEKLLTCGHGCTNTCGTACVVKCRERIKIISPVCGHQVNVECFNSDNVEYISKSCNVLCMVELACGHQCRGKCCSCHQGRLHILCNRPCKRILVCGHECKSPCSKSCPPCKRRCENRCVHSKCPKKCGEPCEKCTEPCEWACAHKKCTLLCGEQCDRTACDKPCMKLLKCQHQCIGLCGEPCPKECRECDKEKVNEIFFGSEDETEARFISLEDCNHIFESEGISQWMNHDIQEKREIQMKTCPKCKVVIRKNLRFGNIVKSCLADIEKVKKVTYGVAKQNMKLQEALLQVLESKSLKVLTICEPLLKVLNASKTRSIQEITIMENIINVATNLADSVEFLDTEPFSVFSDSFIKESFYKLVSYMKNTSTWLICFIQDEYLTASEQQLQDLTWEVHRMKLIVKLLRFLRERTGIVGDEHFNNVLNCVMTYAPFRETDVTKFSSEFKKICERLGDAVINISKFEKETILKAMGLSRGHWYQCPNGHVYCITECGGAVQESRCNECGAKIGGTHHSLLGDNRVATVMDGSQHPAWSDTMNMANYRF